METAIIIIAIGVFAFLLYLGLKVVFFSNCVEFEDEQLTYRVGITNYVTKEGAKARCEFLYKKYNVDAELTILSDNEEPIKTSAVKYFNLKK